jgi:hypothetical protein
MIRKATFSARWGRRAAAIAVVAACGLLAGPAAAQFTMSAGAGYFQPWHGDGGGDFRGSLGATFGREKRFRLSGEFSYREFETELFNVDDVEVESYRLALVFHYRLMPDAVIQPYLGVRYGIAVNLIDDEAIERGRPGNVAVDGIGSGIGIGGIVGLEIPIGPHLFLFSEANLGAEIQLVEDDDDLEVEEIGGVSGLAGLRLVF